MMIILRVVLMIVTMMVMTVVPHFVVAIEWNVGQLVRYNTFSRNRKGSNRMCLAYRCLNSEHTWWAASFGAGSGDCAAKEVLTRYHLGKNTRKIENEIWRIHLVRTNLLQAPYLGASQCPWPCVATNHCSPGLKA